jgi:hypothetical protein
VLQCYSVTVLQCYRCSDALGPAPAPYHSVTMVLRSNGYGVTELWCHGVMVLMLENSGVDVRE